jgi:hypothetical protein
MPATSSRDVAHVNKFAEVTFCTNRYSVPSRFAQRNAFVECFVDKNSRYRGERSRCHPRTIVCPPQCCFGSIAHLDLLRHKHLAIERAGVLAHNIVQSIQMIAIGGAIGTGLFLGAGARLQLAGPALTRLSCVRPLLVPHPFALGELVMRRPMSGSFVSYAHEFFGERASFVAGWM